MRTGRGRFGTNIGFVLSGIGAAVGLGSFWRFPQLASQNGGGAFVVVFVAALLIFGVPLLWAELAIGQRMQQSSVRAFDGLAGRWGRVVGYLFLAVSFTVLGYYTILAGYVLKYMLYSFGASVAADASGFLRESVAGLDALAWGLLVALVTAGIVALGVAKGLERANLIMMPALFVFLVGLVVYAQFQDGAAAGRAFYLGVDWSEIRASTIQAAVAQVFFAVGIGFGIMLTYASYTPIGRPLVSSAAMINGSILVVGFLAGLMVFPLAFSHNLQDAVRDPAAGAADTLFLTMPTTFARIGGVLGDLLMFTFFLMLLFAAISSTISVAEVLVSHLRDEFGWARLRADWIVTEWYFVPAVFAAASPAVFTWFNTFVDVLLFLAVIGLCLVYTFVVKERARFLLGKTEDPPPWMQRAARVAAFITAFVAPVVLLIIFALALPRTLDALLP